MTVVGLHPEELFDKLLDGEITPSERERLRQHLDGCDVCRFEYAARLDFQSEALELATKAPPLALPLRAPVPLGYEPERRTPVPAAVAPPRRRRARALIWGLAAAALITASGAVASGLVGHAAWHPLGALFSPRGAARPAPVAAPKKAALAPPAAAPPAVTPMATVVVPEVGGTVVPVTAPAAPEPPPQHHAPHARGVTAAAATLVASVPARGEAPSTKEAAPEPVKEPSSAAKLFGEANQARRSGDVGRASGLYHLLQDQFPGSPEADLSRVTLSLLLLDSGDARAALSGFERYLAGSSRGLEAEALVGRARALGRLGRRDQEAAAWREVQRKYPRSIYGRQANERLAALGQP
jgi:TolA-binding protein